MRTASRLSIVSDTQLAIYCKSNEICDYIASKNTLLVDAVPYKMIESNVQSMMQPRKYTTVFSDIRETNGSCFGLLSFGIVFPIPKPQYKYILDIFGTDNASLKAHINRHLVRLKEKTTGVTSLYVLVPEEIDIVHVDSILEEHGIVRPTYKSDNPKLKSKYVFAFEGMGQQPSNL